MDDGRAQGAGPGLVSVGPCEFDFAAGQVWKHGMRVRLPEKSLALLAILLERPGVPVARQELRDRLWPRGVFVDFDNNLSTTVARLRAVLGDSARHPRYIETLPRHGYRFVGGTAMNGPGGDARLGRRRMLVLPVRNLGDESGNSICDGLTEELITLLGGFAPDRVGVIARTTAMQFAQCSKSAKAIGDELRLDYIVEASARKSDNKVRITAQLVRTADETQLWAHAYERATGDEVYLLREAARAIMRATGAAR